MCMLSCARVETKYIIVLDSIPWPNYVGNILGFIHAVIPICNAVITRLGCSRKFSCVFNGGSEDLNRVLCVFIRESFSFVVSHLHLDYECWGKRDLLKQMLKIQNRSLAWWTSDLLEPQNEFAMEIMDGCLLPSASSKWKRTFWKINEDLHVV